MQESSGLEYNDSVELMKPNLVLGKLDSWQSHSVDKMSPGKQ